MSDPQREATAIEARLRALGDPERAANEARYLKSERRHLGVRVPEVRREARATAKSVTTRRQLTALARALWDSPVHERRCCAAYLLQARAELLAPADLALLERLIREAETWALVDVLAASVVGPLLLAHPEAAERIDRWARDRDFWVRRAALLSQLPAAREGRSLQRFFRYADAMLEEREFFIRKAIGWVLREASKSRPEEVYLWLLPRAGRASGVTYREAVKYLPPGQRESLWLTRTAATGGR
ncbi:MAG TPA: DNA alkylation repair protein [Solirubrobacterales bacterium]